MTPRIYSNIAVQTSLVSGITAAATSLTVADATGYPAAPFAIVVDVGSSTYEEVMLVTAKAGAVFTVTRAYDGTTAKVHAAGALIIHAAIADDFRGMQLGTRDVSSAAPSDNQGLVWDNANSVWEPGTPSPGGGAGGVLSGTYPNPGFAVNMAEQGELDAHTALTTTAHGGIVPQARTLTINGVTFDLSADRSWTVTGGVSSVTATSPLQSSGGATPDISFANQVANLVLAGPASGGAAAPAFRALVKADLPSALAYEDEANIFTAAQTIAIDNAVTSAVTTLGTFRHTSTGTPAANFGSRFLWQLESSTTIDQDAAALDAIWTTATHASRTSALIFSTVNLAGALTERLRIDGYGFHTITAAKNISDNSTGSGITANLTLNSDASFGSWANNSAAIIADLGMSSAGSNRTAFGVVARAVYRGAGNHTSSVGGGIFNGIVEVNGFSVTNLIGGDFVAQSVSNRSSWAVNYYGGRFQCLAEASAGAGRTATLAAGVYVRTPTSSNVTITSNYGIYIEAQNVGTNQYAILTNAGNIVFNETGDAASDVRIEGDTNANLLFTDASADRVGIGTNAPNSLFDVAGALQCDSLRVDVTPVAETPAATHTAVINFNGTNYKVLCLAA